MKIGILTFHRSENYGSVLQAYALCRALKKLDDGNEVEIIDYSNPHQKALYAAFNREKSIRGVAKNARSLMNIAQLSRRAAGFDAFIRALPLSEEHFESDEALKAHESRYDLVLCGSDQIWNPQSVDFSLAFFGVDFDCKKASYAPSIRNATKADFAPVADEVKKALADFSRVSLREKQSIPVLQALCEQKIECVCDPTLLLTAEDFNSICTKSGKTPKDYIFYYSIDYNAQSVEMVKHISETLNKPVVVIFSTNKTYNVYFKGFQLSKENAPGDFLRLVKNASLVLSTSFHGVALSVIYRKPFFALKTRGYTDARIADLLSEIGLSERYLDEADYKGADFNAPVIYNEEKIDAMRTHSLDYLKDCFND